MEKNTNRTDLLGAGRKKLLQFRQKKDIKGSSSNGKSSKKGGKSDKEVGANMISTAIRGESSDVEVADLSASQAAESSAVPDLTAASVDPSPVPASSRTNVEESGEPQKVELWPADRGLDEIGLTTDVAESAEIVNPAAVKVISSSDIAVSEAESLRADTYASVDLLGPSCSNTSSGGVAISVGRENMSIEDAKNLFVSQEEGFNKSSIQSSKDQEADHSGSKPTDSSNIGVQDPLRDVESLGGSFVGIELGSDERLVLLELNDGVGTFVSATLSSPSTIQSTGEAEHTGGEDKVSASTYATIAATGIQKIDSFVASAPDGCEADRFPAETSIVTGQQPEDAGESSGFSGEHGSPGVLETLKEHLYVTCLEKDLFHLHLAEQSEQQREFDHNQNKLVETISILRASLNEASERNVVVIEELADCRSELQAVTKGQEELKSQLSIVKEERELASSTAQELQTKLERSDLEFSCLSMELGHCKNLASALQVDNGNLNQSLDALVEEKKKLEDEKEHFFQDNGRLLTELADCRGLLAALQAENANLSGDLASVTEDTKKFAEEKELLVCENERLLSELVDCKGLVAALQTEIANLKGSLSVAVDEGKKLKDENGMFLHEKNQFSAEVAAFERQSAAHHAEILQLKADLEEATLHLEELTRENIFLKSSLDVHKAKIREIDESQMQLPSQDREAVCQHQTSTFQSKGNDDANYEKKFYGIAKEGKAFPVHDGLVEGPSSKQIQCDIYNDFSGFVALNGHLDEAEKIMEMLEKAIEGWHSHSASLSRMAGKVAAPGVSKPIQAFESKAHHEVEEKPLPEEYSHMDPYMLTKEQAENLRKVVKQLVLDVYDASELHRVEREGRKCADISLRELRFQHEALRECCDHREASGIEFEVQREAMKQYIFILGEKNNELVTMYEALEQQHIGLKVENGELCKNMRECQLRVAELQSQLSELQQNSEETIAKISSELENLQKDASHRESRLEQEWASTAFRVFKTLEKLDVFMGSISYPGTSNQTHDDIDIFSRVAVSVGNATAVIEDLHKKLTAACNDYEAVCRSHDKLNEKFIHLQGNNGFVVDLLQKIYGNLKKLVNEFSGNEEEAGVSMQTDLVFDPKSVSNYEGLIEKLKVFLSERLQLRLVNKTLNSELVEKIKSIEDMNTRCLDLETISELIEDIRGVISIEETVDEPAVLHLKSLVFSLLQEFKEINEQFNLSRQDSASKVMEFAKLQEEMSQLNSLCLQQENEILVLKERLSQAEGAITALHSELEGKVNELTQSEQQISSVREKLSIAVAKGKETSNELERCSQELQMKDARLQEIEKKLKNYSEAGERMEALESELLYIRNSATVLRESFLLKDSVLQRIEEILEDLELPEHFHSRDIIEKVDRLARSITGNSVPIDWDQKSSVGGGSYSDPGFVVMDARKEGVQPGPNAGGDMRRKFDDLQGKYYGLAEQNEMLKQSLLERNSLIQRFEEALDRINIPSQFRSLEPEDRIEWLASALSEAHQESGSLQMRLNNLEIYCNSLGAELESSQKKISNLEMDLQSVFRERDQMSERAEVLAHDYEEVSKKVAYFELEKDKLQNEVSNLQEKLVEKLGNDELIHSFETRVQKMQAMVCDALLDPGIKDKASGGSDIDYLEGLLRKLVDDYSTLSRDKTSHAAEVITEKDVGTFDHRGLNMEEQTMVDLKNQLEASLYELVHVKEERDAHLEKLQNLDSELEVTKKRTEELQELLNQEEQKSASVREKLNVAVRKGKSLLQQRDSLKQVVEEMSTEVDRLKNEINHLENVIAEHEEKLKTLSTVQQRVEVVESVNLSLQSRLSETEHYLEEREHALSMILQTLGDIDLVNEYKIDDPVQKLEGVLKFCRDLRSALASSEHEAKKSRRAAELLLAELNEVQERNDSLQEELAKAAIEPSELSKERNLAEAVKFEALSHLEKLAAVHIEERKKQFCKVLVLKSSLDQLREGCLDFSNALTEVFSKDFEYLNNLEVGVWSCAKQIEASKLAGLPPITVIHGVLSTNPIKSLRVMAFALFSFYCLFMLKGMMVMHLSWHLAWSKRDHSSRVIPICLFGSPIVEDQLDDNSFNEICDAVGQQLQEFSSEIDSLTKKLYTHSIKLEERTQKLSEVLGIVQKEMASKKDSFELMKSNILRLESLEKERDAENVVIRRSSALLYEACTSSILEIEHGLAQLPGNGSTKRGVDRNLRTLTFTNGDNPFSSQACLATEEHIKEVAEWLLLAVKESTSMQADIVAESCMELKATISNLQEELQEKDIQRERICRELVSQIKEAEAAAASYLTDLKSAKSQVHDLEKHVEVLEAEQDILEQRVKELQDGAAASVMLQERIKSLNDVVAAKEQEIEALMQALDEEEAQMEELTKKVEELARVVQQKTPTSSRRLNNFRCKYEIRDAEISFLRQEFTRCTNDALSASQFSNNRASNEMHDLSSWLDTMISRVWVPGAQLNDDDSNDPEYGEKIRKQISSLISELEDLRAVAQSKDMLLQQERIKVEELLHREETLENSVHEKESQLNLLRGFGESGLGSNMASEIVEVEPVVNKRVVTGTSIASQVRSLRKVNNDQFAIAIDEDPGSNGRLEDEEDDKVHGFKSLTTSQLVPRFTRPLTDMIDGLWVSCDRTLMRKPALRLGIMIYWAVLHALLAAFVV
ncbi:hypothetical protein RJ641_022043 [Dillenia turbinata]|uniref:Uncharacterized protein n=1 Tax=Dillenia turbinata TaxID=194707 RepID=A0AAN8UL17_9MAGN